LRPIKITCSMTRYNRNLLYNEFLYDFYGHSYIRLIICIILFSDIFNIGNCCANNNFVGDHFSYRRYVISYIFYIILYLHFNHADAIIAELTWCHFYLIIFNCFEHLLYYLYQLFNLYYWCSRNFQVLNFIFLMKVSRKCNLKNNS